MRFLRIYLFYIDLTDYNDDDNNVNLSNKISSSMWTNQANIDKVFVNVCLLQKCIFKKYIYY